MLILAIDPGKARSLARRYRTDDATHEFRAVLTRPPWIPQHWWRQTSHAVKGFHWKMMVLGFVLAGMGLHVPYVELWGLAVLIVILFVQLMRPRRRNF